MYEACEGASEHLRSEHHRPPLMPEIRLADRARMVKEESGKHITDLTGAGVIYATTPSVESFLTLDYTNKAF